MNSLESTNSVVLSICIPTFNRAPFLKECLESIVSQFQNPEIQKTVEIIVSNNGSTDNTEEIISQFTRQFPNIRAIGSSENVGFDKNVLAVVGAASGEYCWLLGDDDALFEDALASIVPYLRTRKYEYILANCWGYNREMTQKAVSRPNMHITEDQEYGSLSEFIHTITNYQDIVGYFGGMSVQIFKRTIWEAVPDKETYIGSQAIHLHLLLLGFRSSPMAVLHEPLVKTRADNMRWDSFPGLNSVKKRAFATRDGQKWIYNLYNIPYSNLELTLVCYWNIVCSTLYNLARNTIFKNRNVRNFIKQLLGK